MNRSLVFPERKTTTLPQLQEDTIRLVAQLGDGATLQLGVEGYTLASGLNTIRHNMKRAPRAVQVIPYANVAWWIPTKPDDEFIYIQTGGALTGDIVLWV